MPNRHSISSPKSTPHAPVSRVAKSRAEWWFYIRCRVLILGGSHDGWRSGVGHWLRRVCAFALKPEYGGFGPASIGFYRVFCTAAMWLVLWAAPRKRTCSPPGNDDRPTCAGRFFFAVDLVSWHWSIKYTTVANATLLANFAPLWVTLWAGRLFGEKSSPVFSSHLAWHSPGRSS